MLCGDAWSVDFCGKEEDECAGLQRGAPRSKKILAVLLTPKKNS